MTAPLHFVCIHGHFYQPPRENPWTSLIDPQPTAAPFHDWNERVTAECYAPNSAARILDAANVDPMKKISDLGEDEVNRIRQVIEQEGNVEGDLRKDVSMHIKRLIDIQSYRGIRHRRSLPTRGQRTHTNARTRKGPRKGTIAGKKKATAKT